MSYKSTFLYKILAIVAFLVWMPVSQGMEENYDDWEIVPNDYGNLHNYEENNEEDFELKAKAFCNTAVNVLTGVGITAINIGLNVLENETIKYKKQFEADVALGSHIVGNLYGQGVALMEAYENEKELLKTKK